MKSHQKSTQGIHLEGTLSVRIIFVENGTGKLLAFHFVLIPLGKVWTFSPLAMVK